MPLGAEADAPIYKFYLSYFFFDDSLYYKNEARFLLEFLCASLRLLFYICLFFLVFYFTLRLSPFEERS